MFKGNATILMLYNDEFISCKLLVHFWRALHLAAAEL